jgi:hypothetical protein
MEIGGLNGKAKQQPTFAFHNSGCSVTMKLKNYLFTLEQKSASVLPIPLLRKAV